jgi:hypothetical protein
MTDRVQVQPGDPRRAAELAARLAHDVGKYIGRTARNLPPEPSELGKLDGALLAMLLRDLYGAGPGSRPGALFAPLRQELAPLLCEPERALLSEAAAGLLRLDELEPEVRAAKPPALAEALRCALLIEQQLRKLSRELLDKQRRPAPTGDLP